MFPIKNIYMHFFPLPCSLKGETLIVSCILKDFSILLLGIYVNSKEKAKWGSLVVGFFFFFELFKSSGKGYFFFFLTYINGFFFFFFFLIYTRMFHVYLHENQWVAVHPGAMAASVSEREARGF